MITKNSLQITESLALLQTRGDHFTRQLVHEKQRISQYEEQLKEIQDEITHLREENRIKAMELMNKHISTSHGAYQKRIDGLDPSRLAKENQKKMVQTLEGRLNKSLIRNNSIQAENNTIKEKIDELRRKILNDLRKKEEIQESLVQIQGKVDEIMKRAAIVVDQRDAILELQSQLENVNEQERVKFEQEYEKLSQYILEQNDLLKSSIDKVASNVASKLHKVEFESNSEQEDESFKRQDTQKERLKIRLEELERQYALQRSTYDDERDKLKAYDDCWSKLKLVSGLSSIHEIVEDFKKHEEESYSSFNYIQSLNEECDSLANEKNVLEAELQQIKSIQQSATSERMAKMVNYQQRLDEMKQEKKALHVSISKANDIIQVISSQVGSILSKLKSEIASCNHNNPGRTCSHVNTVESLCDHDVLKQMEWLEKYTIQIIEAYAPTLIDKPKRRPSILMSPKIFSQNSLGSPNTSKDLNLGEDCNEDNDSDEDGSIGGRPISVQDMRKQHAEKLKSPFSMNVIADESRLVKSFFTANSNEV